MQLDDIEIAEGLVAYLDQSALTANEQVLDTFPQADAHIRPFVCVRAANGCSQWVPLTTSWRKERLAVAAAWRSGGEASWSGLECYLNDGANVYIGPNGAFIAASSGERTDATNRSRLSPEGLAAIRAEIEKQRKRRKVGHDE